MDVSSNKVACLSANIAYQNIFSFLIPNMPDIQQVCESILITNKGKIVLEGSILDAIHMDRIRKGIGVVFNDLRLKDQFETLWQMSKINEDEVLIEVEHGGVTAVTPHLFENLPFTTPAIQIHLCGGSSNLSFVTIS